jgi:hypothetical protein
MIFFSGWRECKITTAILVRYPSFILITWSAIFSAMPGVGSSSGSGRRVQPYPHAVIVNALCK